MLTFVEKQTSVISCIAESLEFGPNINGHYQCALESDYFKNIPVPEIENLFIKLEREKKILLFTQKRHYSGASIQLEFKPEIIEFNVLDEKFFKKVKPNKIQTPLSQQENFATFSIKYLYGKILLNGFILIGEPGFNAKNDLFMQFLSEHPEEVITFKQICEATKSKKVPTARAIHKDLETMGFRKGLKQFFEINETEMKFHNPIHF